MKNKRVLYIFMSLLMIVVLVLLSSVLFAVKDVAVDVKGDGENLDVAGINKTLEQNLGKSIFFVDEQKISAELELAFPYLKVINIERVFPSKIVLHCYRRSEVFAVPLSSGKYAAVDETGKVLSVYDTNTTDYPEGSVKNNVLIKLEESGYPQADAGGFITGGKLDTAYSFYLACQNYEMTAYNFKATFKEISFSGDTLAVRTSYGATINYSSAHEDFTEKVRLSLGVLATLSGQQLKNSEITIISGTEWISGK